MAHTPGPWKVGGPYPAVSVCWIDADDNWCPVADLWKWQDGKAPEWVYDNARLIAAAPEMLEALKDARQFIEMYCKATNYEPTQIPTYNLLCAIIAKAEGQP